MQTTAVKEELKEKKKKDYSYLKKYAYSGIKFLLCFILSQTSLFFVVAPFAPSAFLSVGGGVSAYLGAMLGSYISQNFEAMFYVTTAYILKLFLKSEKADGATLLISGVIIYSSFILQGNFLPYDVIMRCACVVICVFSYYVFKKAYKAQFIKSFKLKISQKEAYCSIFLLFALISGISFEIPIYFIDIGCILKLFLIMMSGFYFGIGGGAATGALLGIFSGNTYNYSIMYMSIFSIYGLFSGIFSKFSKFTTLLGVACGYVLTLFYVQNANTLIGYGELITASALFMFVPKKAIYAYLSRYTNKQPAKDMMSTINSITAGRLENLANSFTCLSNEIVTPRREKYSIANVNSNSLFDFLSEKVCRKCALKSLCWQSKYDSTVDALTKAIDILGTKKSLTENDFDKNFVARCTKISDITNHCINFYDILRVNSIWKNKMEENTHAFKQQFIEMSKIICELKKNIETNKYYEAELSNELYSVLSDDGLKIKEAIVIKDASGTFFVKITMGRCNGEHSCIAKIKDMIYDVLGVCVTRTEGGCGESQCTLIFKEGIVSKLEKRVHSISKNDNVPAGDSYIISEICPNKYLVTLCDGMGTGKEASEISSSVVKLIEEMLKAGFSEEATYKMINSFIIANLSGTGFSTVDIMVIDMKKMEAKIIKNGACPTYIKHKGKDTLIVQNQSLPAGIKEQKPFVKIINVNKDDIILMVSDGAIDSCEDKQWIKNILNKNTSFDLSETVDLICSVAQRDFEKREDDITVLGIKIA